MDEHPLCAAEPLHVTWPGIPPVVPCTKPAHDRNTPHRNDDHHIGWPWDKAPA